MLSIPNELERIEDRRMVANIEPILAKAKAILDSSETIARKQRELDRKPGRRFYSIVSLMLAYLLKEIFQVPYDDTRYIMFGSFCEIMGLPKRNGAWMKPSGSTICEFKRDVLEPMLDDLTKELVEAMLDRLKVVHRGKGYVVLTLDSTPAQASRYNFDAEYNGHYRIRMDKMHIIMIDGMPLFMIPTGGNEGDNEPVEDLLTLTGSAVADSGFEGVEIKAMADGGYDSFKTFYQFHKHLGVELNCHIRETARFSEEASWESVSKKYSRMYKCPGFDPNRKNDERFVLTFLSKNGQEELVGKYFRNKELLRQEQQMSSGVKDTDRQVCETMHHSMKSWLDFTTVKLRHKLRESTLRCRFFLSQLLSVIFKGYVTYD